MAVPKSEASRALHAFARGDDDVPEALLRQGAVEVTAENRRLRLILDTLSRAGVGEGILVEFESMRGGGINVVLCCASRDEGQLMLVLTKVICSMLGPEGRVDAPVVTGTEAMKDDAEPA